MEIELTINKEVLSANTDTENEQTIEEIKEEISSYYDAEIIVIITQYPVTAECFVSNNDNDDDDSVVDHVIEITENFLKD